MPLRDAPVHQKFRSSRHQYVRLWNMVVIARRSIEISPTPGDWKIQLSQSCDGREVLNTDTRA